MNFTPKTAPKAPALALTSMLDVIFLLLCFFVTASVYSRWEPEMDLNLPTAVTAKDPTRLPGEVVVNVDKEGKVTLNGREISGEDLSLKLTAIAARFKSVSVIVRADGEVRYENLVSVIDVCRKSGVSNFALATAQHKNEDK